VITARCIKLHQHFFQVDGTGKQLIWKEQ